MSNEPWRRDVVEALRRGAKIEAIKLYREATGTGLAEAKSVVEALEQSLRTGQLPEVAVMLPDDLEHALIEDLRSGNFISAIKRHRDATGSGLYESKQAMEALALRKGISIASPMPIAIWMSAIAVALAGVIACMFLR